MKTEKFEDKIRKKLESIEPQFQEHDWENFQKFSNPKSFGTNDWYNGSIFKIAASIALIGTIFLGVSQYISNKNLANTLAEITLKNEALLTKQKQLEATIESNQKYNYNQKSEILNKSNIEEKSTLNIENKSETSDNLIANNTQKLNSNFGLYEDSKKMYQNNKKNINNSENLIQKNRLTKNKNRNNFTQSQDKAIANFDDTKPKGNRLFGRNKNGIKVDESNTKQENEFEIVDFSENNIINNDLIFNELKINQLASKNIKLDSTKKFVKQFRRADFAYYKPHKEEKKKLYFTLADAYLRTGISANIGRNIISYGINSELFLDQRISLKVGANKLKLEGNSFITERDFKDETKRDFRDKYHVKVPPTKPILNIKEEVDLVVIPTSINYYHPLKNNLFILSSLGTDLDISGTKSIVFNYSKGPFIIPPPVYSYNQNSSNYDFDDLDLDRLSQKTEKKLFNNLTLALGAEKRFGKLALQGKIIDQFLVKNVEYRKKNVITGELGLSYRF